MIRDLYLLGLGILLLGTPIIYLSLLEVHFYLLLGCSRFLLRIKNERKYRFVQYSYSYIKALAKYGFAWRDHSNIPILLRAVRSGSFVLLAIVFSLFGY